MTRSNPPDAKLTDPRLASFLVFIVSSVLLGGALVWRWTHPREELIAASANSHGMLRGNTYVDKQSKSRPEPAIASPVQSWQEMQAQTARYKLRFQRIAKVEYPAAAAKRRAAHPNLDAVKHFAENYKRRFEEQRAEDAAWEEKQWKSPADADDVYFDLMQLLLGTGFIHALRDATPVGTMTVAELAVDPAVKPLAMQEVKNRLFLHLTAIPQLANEPQKAPADEDAFIEYLRKSEGSYLAVEKQLMDRLAMDERTRSYLEDSQYMEAVESICGRYLAVDNLEVEELRFECEEMFYETGELLNKVPRDSAEHQELLTGYGEMLALMRRMNLWRNLDRVAATSLQAP